MKIECKRCGMFLEDDEKPCPYCFLTVPESYDPRRQTAVYSGLTDAGSSFDSVTDGGSSFDGGCGGGFDGGGSSGGGD